MGRCLLLVEDDEKTRQRLARSIRASGLIEHLAEAGSCAEARDQLHRSAPDWLITDLGLPDGSGVELIQEFRRRSEAGTSMVISAFGDESSVIAALRAGAVGYLLKDASGREIQRALRDLLDGGAPLSPAVARYLLKCLPSDSLPENRTWSRTDKCEPRAPSLLEPLSAREREVLQLIADGASYAEIAQQLHISLNTVNTHVRHLYGKLAVGSRGKAVKAAERYGLLPRAL